MALRPITFVQKSSLHRLMCKNYSSKTPAGPPKNQLDNLISAQHQDTNGVVYDKRPYRIVLEAKKKYSWCLCGKSHNQPFCDGTHKTDQLKIKQKPVRFMVDETKEYWLCNCKQTANRPFCDGTHKSPTIQEGPTIVKY